MSSTSFTFRRPAPGARRPAGAVAEKSYVQALEPSFVPLASTGNDPAGAFDLQ